jgi:hypothetical protein
LSSKSRTRKMTKETSAMKTTKILFDSIEWWLPF